MKSTRYVSENDTISLSKAFIYFYTLPSGISADRTGNGNTQFHVTGAREMNKQRIESKPYPLESNIWKSICFRHIQHAASNDTTLTHIGKLFNMHKYIRNSTHNRNRLFRIIRGGAWRRHFPEDLKTICECLLQTHRASCTIHLHLSINILSSLDCAKKIGNATTHTHSQSWGHTWRQKTKAKQNCSGALDFKRKIKIGENLSCGY